METHYDINAWADETTLGRHIFNYNFRMTGTELRGWELAKSVTMQNESGVTEKVYVWQKKGGDEHQLLRISIAELNTWRTAQAQLQNQLFHTMRPELPRATGKLANTGDINYMAKDPKSKVIAMTLFTRGNLSISISSVGDKPVDVTKAAKALDTLFTEPPEKDTIDQGMVEMLSPRTLEVVAKKTAKVIEKIPDAALRGGWLKVIAPDGEISREDDTLVYVSPKSGRKRIGKYVFQQ